MVEDNNPFVDDRNAMVRNDNPFATIAMAL